MHLVILGAGPAGSAAATHAARLGVDVTLIERDVVGGAADLWDCVPSKAMIATGGAMSFLSRSAGMGLVPVHPAIDITGLRARIASITDRLRESTEAILTSQNVRIVRAAGRLDGPHRVVCETLGDLVQLEADAVLLSTGSRPRIPDWARVDGDRVLTTRDAYPPKELPEHVVVIGSGVTGVELVHMFSSLGSAVTLVVSRQQVLPTKDPEVAAVLEADFLRRGVKLMKGARAVRVDRDADSVQVHCDDGRIARGTHALLAIGSVPSSSNLGLSSAGVEVDAAGYVPVNHHCQTNIGHIYAAGDVCGRLPLSSVAMMQGRKVAEHVAVGHTVSHRHLNYDKAPSAIFTEPEIADVGLAEADAFAVGRKIRVTKVPFAATAKALIENDPRGFVKIVSDPATGVVLGGSIVGQHAAELISVIALCVTAGLRVQDIAESMFVHPTLAQAIAEAAE